MDWLKKISLKKYLFGTLINFIFIGIYHWKSPKAFGLLSFLVLCVILNQALLVSLIAKSYKSLMNPAQKNDLSAVYKKSIGFLFAALLKLVVMVISFWLLANYDKGLIVQGLVIYTFQLIIFILSIKKYSKFFHT